MKNYAKRLRSSEALEPEAQSHSSSKEGATLKSETHFEPAPARESKPKPDSAPRKLPGAKSEQEMIPVPESELESKPGSSSKKRI